jgi:hypothetical protein
LIVGLIAVSAAPTTAQAQQAYAYQNIFDDNTGLTLNGLWAVDATPNIGANSAQGASAGNSLNWNNGVDFSGGTLTGTARTPTIDMSGIASPADASMTFYCWYNTETGGSYDQKWIRIYNATTNTQVYQQQFYVGAAAPGNCSALSSWHQHTWTAMPNGTTGIPIVIEFFFNAVDGAGNNGQGWFVDDLVIIGDDTAPPATISDLAAANPTLTEAELSWTSPTDNDISGQAAAFDLRYATAPITQATFAQATTVTGEPAPGAPGTVHNVLISGLNPGTTYHFAIVTTDYAGNASPISNVPSIDTLAPPPVGGGSATQAVVTEDKYTNCGAGVAGSPLGLVALAGLLALAAAGRKFFGK